MLYCVSFVFVIVTVGFVRLIVIMLSVVVLFLHNTCGIVQNVIYAEWYLCWMVFMLNGIYAEWHSCWMAFMLNGIHAGGIHAEWHSCWMAFIVFMLYFIFAECQCLIVMLNVICVCMLVLSVIYTELYLLLPCSVILLKKLLCWVSCLLFSCWILLG